MYGDLPLGLFVLPDAEVRHEAGYIYTGSGRPILEQNAGFLRKKKFLRPRYPVENNTTANAPTIDDALSLLSSCHDCFWHWMGDSLPKVILAEECGFNGSYLIPAPDVAPWARESLQLIGIAGHRIVVHHGEIVRVSRLSIPTYFCGYNAHFNIPFVRLYREWVRRFVPHTTTATPKRLFVGRRHSADARRVLNQPDVERLVHEFGFVTVYFEDLPLAEQLGLAVSAEAIIAPHSSGLSHLLFMDEGARVIELFPHKRQQSCDCYETLARVTPHRYCALESELPREGDIEVNLERLSAELEALRKPNGE